MRKRTRARLRFRRSRIRKIPRFPDSLAISSAPLAPPEASDFPLKPSDPDLNQTLAMALVDESRYAEALLAAERARRHGADEVNCLLVTALARRGLNQNDEAGVHYARALTMAEERPSSSPVRRILLQRAARFFGRPSTGSAD